MIQFARVVSVEDPLELRRVKVRVLGVHGEAFPQEMLPWANSGKYGGAPDTGEYPVYIKGQTVMVDFENDDITRPFVITCLAKKAHPSQKYGDADWGIGDADSDVPEEFKDPRVHGVFKTHNGAMMAVVETPGGEKMMLIDRAGQFFETCSPLESEEVGILKRGTEVAPSVEMEGKLTADAYMKAVDLSGNMFEMKTTVDGKSSTRMENPRNGNLFNFDEDGLKVEVLGGADNGGLTLVMDSAGMRLNGVEFATRKIVDLFEQFSSTVAMSTKPGSPAPMFPAKLAVFNVRKDASINAEGMKTKL